MEFHLRGGTSAPKEHGGFDGNCSLLLQILYKKEAGNRLDFFISKAEVVGFYLEIRLFYDIIRLLWRFSLQMR